MSSASKSVLVTVGNRTYDCATPIDISLHISPDAAPNAFSLPAASFEAFRIGDFVGSVELGGPVRCDIVTLAPHGNGTHTECVGHIAGREFLVSKLMHDLLDEAELVTVTTESLGADAVVTRAGLEGAWKGRDTTTLILRTLPNDDGKRTMRWSAHNPPYIHLDAMQLIVEHGIKHLMVDVPSVDREEDAGALVAHHCFWQWPENPRLDCTITEMVYVPNEVPDGRYLVFFNVAPFDGDAAPSRPMIVAESREQRAESREQRAANREQRAESREQRAAST